MKNVSFYQGKDHAIERKRRLAQALIEQGQQPQGTEVVSGYAVKQSPLAGLAKALSIGIGGYEDNQADQMEKKSDQDKNDVWARALSQITNQSKLPNGESVQWNPVKGDPRKAYAQILMSNPETAPYGIDSMMGQMEDQQQADQTQKLEGIRNQMTPYQAQEIALEKEKLARALQPTPQAAPVPQAVPQSFGPPQPQVAGPPQPVSVEPPVVKSQPVAPTQTQPSTGEFGPPTPQGYITGDKFLQTLDPSYARMVKAVGDGDVAFPTGSRMNADSKKLVQDALQYKPDADALNIKNRGKFAFSQLDNTTRSFSVVHDHLDTFKNLVDALDNGNIQSLNAANQAFKQQFGSDAPTNFDAAKRIVGDEIVKTVVGASGALGDRETAQESLSRANSPAQLKGVIDTYQDLIRGQINGVKRQYENNVNRDDFDKKLSPGVVDELKGPKKIASDEEYDALPSGAEFIDPDGKPRRKP